MFIRPTVLDERPSVAAGAATSQLAVEALDPLRSDPAQRQVAELDDAASVTPLTMIGKYQRAVTALIGIGGIGVVAASVVIDAVGDPWPTQAGLSAVLLAVAVAVIVLAVAVIVLVAGPVTLSVERARVRTNPRMGSERGEP